MRLSEFPMTDFRLPVLGGALRYQWNSHASRVKFAVCLLFCEGRQLAGGRVNGRQGEARSTGSGSDEVRFCLILYPFLTDLFLILLFFRVLQRG